MKLTSLLFFASFVAACSMRGNGVTGIFDLGLAPDATGSAEVAVADVEVPPWLDTTDMHYRLIWRDRQSLQPFSESRWAGTPAAMLTLRLRQAFNSSVDHGTRARCILHVRLDEFSQVFSSETSSRGLLQAHSTLLVKDATERGLSRDWRIEQPAESTNASSGAAALATATKDFTQSLRSWVSSEPACAR
jgi:cholesterol transport system auxiliary component